MINEAVLLESGTLRGSLATRIEALDRVKALMLLPDGIHVTTRMVADYFEVTEEVIRQLLARHRGELESHGAVVLRGADLDRYKRDVLSRYPQEGPQPRANLCLFPRRAVLNVAMLLRDSEVARSVRRALLDLAEPGGRPAPEWADAMIREIAERVGTTIGAELARTQRELAQARSEFAQARGQVAELRAVVGALGRRLELERGLVAGMSVRMASTACDVRTLGGRVDMLCELATGPWRRRGVRTGWGG